MPLVAYRGGGRLRHGHSTHSLERLFFPARTGSGARELTFDDMAVRRLFVGTTRATMKLTLVVSEKSARVSIDQL